MFTQTRAATAMASSTGTSAESGGAAELAEQRVPFRAYRVQPTDVGPLLGLGELLLEIAKPLPVRLEGLPVGEIPEPWLDSDPCARAD